MRAILARGVARVAERRVDAVARADEHVPRVERPRERLRDLLRLRVALEELGEGRLAEDHVGERDVRGVEEAARGELGEQVDAVDDDRHGARERRLERGGARRAQRRVERGEARRRADARVDLDDLDLERLGAFDGARAARSVEARREEHAPVDARAIAPHALVRVEHRLEQPIDLVRPAPRQDRDGARVRREPERLARDRAIHPRRLARRVTDVVASTPRDRQSASSNGRVTAMRSMVPPQRQRAPRAPRPDLRRAVPEDAHAALVEARGEARVELRVVHEEGRARLSRSRGARDAQVRAPDAPRARRDVANAERRRVAHVAHELRALRRHRRAAQAERAHVAPERLAERRERRRGHAIARRLAGHDEELAHAAPSGATTARASAAAIASA